MKSKDKVNDHGLGVFEGLSCIIKDRFYFAIKNGIPSPSSNIHAFSIDDVLVYEKFYDDFGPFNLAQIYRYCRKVNKKLKAPSLSNNRIVHYTSSELTKRTNAAFLVGCYQIIYLNRSAEDAYKNVLIDKFRTFMPYRDASSGPSYYDLNLSDCLRAVQKAVRFGFLNFDNFDLEDYEHNEKVENGDLSWIVPNKFIAFSGPHARTMIDNGYPMHAPEFYLPYFRKNSVTNVVRLNQKMYESSRFTRAGISHHELFFPDGSVPSKSITNQFLEICETATGVIAVHCKAGLGRTGTLIGCYLMKHYRFTAPEAIAWIRICRPGSIIGQQQNWLEEQQSWCWEEGRRERRERSPSPLPFRHRDEPLDAGKVIYINKRSNQLPEELGARMAGGDSTGPSKNTSTKNEENLGDGAPRGRVYHHKIQIAGRSQSPPANYGGNDNNNNAGLNDNSESQYASGPSRDLLGSRTIQGISPSRSMDLGPKLNSYKTTLTQGDQLNRIKVIRKRNKQRKGGVSKEPNSHSISPNFAGSYPRLTLSSGGGGGDGGSALDFREIYNLENELSENALSTAEPSEVEEYNRFYYGTKSPQPVYRVTPGNKRSTGSSNNKNNTNGDSLDNPIKSPTQKISASRSSQALLRASYPEGSDSNSSSIATQTLSTMGSLTRKFGDFVSHSPIPPLPPVLSSNGFPVIKTRIPGDTSYQLLYPSARSNSSVTSDGNSRSDERADDKGYFLRSHPKYRNASKADYVGLKYTNVANGRSNGNRAPSPSPTASPNQVIRHQIRSSSLKNHLPPTANSSVVYADIQTKPAPEFDYRPRASYRQSFNH